MPKYFIYCVPKILANCKPTNATIDQIAAEVPYTPLAPLVATDVQAGLDEIKTDNELESLVRGGLSLIYLGFESGSDFILEKIRKGASKEEQRQAVVRAQNCGIDVSATIVTGLGGKELWKEHIGQSAELVNTTAPKYLSTLSLMIAPDCRERFISAFEAGFTLQDDKGMLEEERLLISLINSPNRIIFRSNHISNALALSGTLPRDKEKLITQIDQALKGESGIRPRWMRGL